MSYSSRTATATISRTSPKMTPYRDYLSGLEAQDSELLSTINLDDSGFEFDDEQLLDFEYPTGGELDKAIDEAWDSWKTPENKMTTRYQKRVRQDSHVERMTSEGDGEGEVEGEEEVEMALVEGARPQHVFVPQWVYLAREQHPRVWVAVLKFYFSHYVWPCFTALPPAFIDACRTADVTPDMFERTRGFAPVWLFLLKELVHKRVIAPAHFQRCVDAFFDSGRFPDVDSLPRALGDMMRRARVSDDMFFEVMGV